MTRETKHRPAAPALLTATVVALGIGVVIDLSAARTVRRRVDRALESTARSAARQSAIARGNSAELFREAAHAQIVDVFDALEVAIDVEPRKDETVQVRLDARGLTQTRFARVLGGRSAHLHRSAVAVRLPLDVAVAVDLSYSLARNGGLAATRSALAEFAGYFENQLDRMAFVAFSTWAEERLPLTKDFREGITYEAAKLQPLTDAATDEGLRVAKLALARAAPRDEAFRAIVLFTDGQPTAFADRFRMPDQSIPRYYQGVIAAYLNGPSYRGLFQQSDGRKVRHFDRNGQAITTDNASYARSVAPKYLPGRFRVDGDNIRLRAAARAESWASIIRNEGYTIYVIGLGGGVPDYAADLPDAAFLRRLANEGGAVDAYAPRGRALLVARPEELSVAFATVADELLERATR